MMDTPDKVNTTYGVSIQTGPASVEVLQLETGTSTIIVGANGSGKTRLGVSIEQQLPDDRSIRITAHRSLAWSDNISAISLDRALTGLHYGYADGKNKIGNRYQSKPAVAMVTDFEFLLQAFTRSETAPLSSTWTLTLLIRAQSLRAQFLRS